MKRILVIAASVLFLAFLTSCSKKEPGPEDRFSEYIKLWNDQKFAEMYGFLSDNAKKTISKDEFVKRYEKIYSDLEINNLKVTFKKPDEEKPKEEKVSFPFSVKMESVAGPINFDHKANLVKEERNDKQNWYIDWNSTYIFPELTKEDKIGLSDQPAKRGEIFDRNGDVLAVNGTVYEIGVVPEQMGDQKDEIIKNLAGLLKISEEQIQKAINADWVQPGYFVPLTKIPQENTGLLNQLVGIPSVVKKNIEARVYPYKDAAAHLIGYVGPVTADDLEKLKGKGYTNTDVIGKRGLEQVLESQLKGKNGTKITIKKPDGSETLLAEKPVEDGKDITLTIDINLQKKVFDQLAGEAGASVVLQPQTGETLALVSSPSFDPNQPALGMSEDERKALEENGQQPLLTRFKLTYAPGSVIKPITAAIGLSNNVITIDEAKQISGLKWQKDKSWGNYFVTRVKDPNAPVKLEEALLFSDNIYFAQTAVALGKEKFQQGLKNFGFEEELPYLYPLEPSKTGSLDSEVKLADSGYGQGQIEMNILHLASAYTPLVNNGNMIKPILSADESKSQIWKASVISQDQAANLSNMLRKVVEDPRGTAYSAKIPGYPLAGKTGTAEIKLKQGEKGTENGWFVAYNPDTPDFLIAMMVENVQDKGGSKAVVEKVKNILTK